MAGGNGWWFADPDRGCQSVVWSGVSSVADRPFGSGALKVVVAEKPSVARDLAQVLGARQRGEGWIGRDDLRITWAFGHLANLKPPDGYDPALKRWSLQPLPIVPERFEVEVSGDDGARKQFRIVADLLRSAERIVCATDAGREGELIFRYILELAELEDREFERLWLSSMTPAAIRKAFSALKPGSDYDPLFAAARCRDRADWIIGINATRCYTVRHRGHGDVLWTIGRVQTPVLALVVERDDAIRDFDSKPFFELRTKYRDVLFRYAGEGGDNARFDAKDAADEVLAKITGQDFEILAVEAKTEKERPPLLHDLTSLQREMNQRIGLSAARTLQIAQKLYEQKLLTYPRTDSRYLPVGMRDELAGTLGSLRPLRPDAYQHLDVPDPSVDPLPLPNTKRVFDDKKIQDHHAILPTGQRPGHLDRESQAVFDAVFLRALQVFCRPCAKDVTRVRGKAAEAVFRARGSRVVDPGWTSLEPAKAPPKTTVPKKGAKKGAESEDQVLPEFTVGERGPHEPFVHKGETKPPSPYTDNSLLAAMETAGKLVDDEELREAMKARGLGTPATRASILETLVHRGYLQRHKKQIRATDLGRVLIALIPNRELKSPEMTGEWEARLASIERGEMDPDAFLQQVIEFAQRVVHDSGEGDAVATGFGPCPTCGAPVIEGRTGWGCSKWEAGCAYRLPRDQFGLRLDGGQVRALLGRGIVLRPVTLPEHGRRYLYRTAQGRIGHVEPPQSNRKKRGEAKAAGNKASGAPASATKKAPAKVAPSDLPCPLCGRPVLETDKAYGCSGWREGCALTIWKVVAGKKVTPAMAKKLLTKGATQQLKGFKSKSGQAFDAALKLVDGKVQLDPGG